MNVTGSYEAQVGGNTLKLVLLESGTTEAYFNDEKGAAVEKWSVKDGEVHSVFEGIEPPPPELRSPEYRHIEVPPPYNCSNIYRCESNGDLTLIAIVGVFGQRSDAPQQITYKKIK